MPTRTRSETAGHRDGTVAAQPGGARSDKPVVDSSWYLGETARDLVFRLRLAPGVWLTEWSVVRADSLIVQCEFGPASRRLDPHHRRAEITTTLRTRLDEPMDGRPVMWRTRSGQTPADDRRIPVRRDACAPDPLAEEHCRRQRLHAGFVSARGALAWQLDLAPHELAWHVASALLGEDGTRVGTELAWYALDPVGGMPGFLASPGPVRPDGEASRVDEWWEAPYVPTDDTTNRVMYNRYGAPVARVRSTVVRAPA